MKTMNVLATATLFTLGLMILPGSAEAQPRGAILRGEEGGAVLRRGNYEGEQGELDTAGGAILGPNRGGAVRGFEAEGEEGTVTGGSAAAYDRSEGVAVRRGFKGADTDNDGTYEYGVETETTYDRDEGVNSQINTVNEGDFVCSTGAGCDQVSSQ